MGEIVHILSSPQFWAIFVPAIIAIFTLYRSKAAEREAEWRKEKLRLYLNFVEALSGITDCEKSPEGDMKFAKACNDLHALACQRVLSALHSYQRQIALSNSSSSPESKQAALNRLVLEMRRDLKIKLKDSEADFEMLLWTAGVKRDAL